MQIYHFGQWGYVCGDYWDMLDAAVLCHQLGYSTAVAARPEYSYNNIGSWPYKFACTGYEATLMQCSHSNLHYCTRASKAQLNCSSGNMH